MCTGTNLKLNRVKQLLSNQSALPSTDNAEKYKKINQEANEQYSSYKDIMLSNKSACGMKICDRNEFKSSSLPFYQHNKWLSCI